MVWGAFSFNRTIPLHRIQGSLTGASYVQLLEKCVTPIWDQRQETIYQQDNARPHKSRIAMQWFQDHGIELLQWLANSPDLNPTENCWSCLDSKLDIEVIHGMDELFVAASRHFANIDRDVVTHLIQSMSRRGQSLIANRGGHIDH